MLGTVHTCLKTRTYNSYHVCWEAVRFNQIDIPDENCDGFLQLQKTVRIVSKNCYIHCSAQIRIRRCEIGSPWWANVLWNDSVPEHISLREHELCVQQRSPIQSRRGHFGPPIKGAKNHFTVKLRIDSLIEDYWANYPILWYGAPHTNLLIV
jgi:hypothetical protein